MISKSAFSQSRRKLKPETFIGLRENQFFYFEGNAPFKKDWKGMHVFAIVGRKFNLPHTEEVKEEFGLSKISMKR